MRSRKCHRLIDSYHFCTCRYKKHEKNQKKVKHVKCQPLSESYYFDRFRVRKRERKAPILHYLLSHIFMQKPDGRKNTEKLYKRKSEKGAKRRPKITILGFFPEVMHIDNVWFYPIKTIHCDVGAMRKMIKSKKE